MEAKFLLDDLKALHKDVSVLRYDVADYQLPLLAANARYRYGRFLEVFNKQGSEQAHGTPHATRVVGSFIYQ